MPSFHDFFLQPATRAVLANMEITEPTPIQAEAIPALLAGNDLVGQSATGSGKTLAYSIPLVERLARDRVAQALVLVPTRELAVQVNAVLSKLAAGRRLTTALLVGGRPYGSQISALRYGSQIIVGTPGRVKDHLERGTLVMSQLRICVLDEADQMLDSGFAPVIEEILATTPDTRQMALFSATMPGWVEKLQQKFLKDPVKIDLARAMGAPDTIEQVAYQVSQEQKMAALCTLLQSTEGESSLIFGKTKFGVEKLGKQLNKLGFTVGTLHGDKSQRAREEVLSAFRRGQVQTLLATNVAARGLDIQGIYQVINYELPESSELFTHRIGRTGRMGRQGKAITLLAPSDVPKWRRMARSLGQAVAVQRLAIDKEAIVPVLLAPPARPEPAPEPEIKPQQARGRKPVSREQKRDKFARIEHASLQDNEGLARPEHKSRSASGLKKRRKERVISEIPEYAPVWEPERSYAGQARDGRQSKGKQPGSGRAMAKHKASMFVVAEPPHRTGRRKPAAMPVARARRAAGSKRSAGR